MEREIVKTSKYKKELKRVSQWNNFDSIELDNIIKNLCKGKAIDKKYRVHPMINKKLYKGCMSLHFTADILVMYKLTDDKLYLSRIGSHSQLLGNERNNRKG